MSGLGADVGVQVFPDGPRLLLTGRDTGVRVADVAETLIEVALRFVKIRETAWRVTELADIGELQSGVELGPSVRPVTKTPVGWIPQDDSRVTLGAAVPLGVLPARVAECLAAIEADTRSAGQRHHDGLLAALRALLCSGELGQHNGLPAAIIVSTSLTELQSRAGHALTGGGTLLPMSDVIRLASHANHYLRIFDHGRELALYHTKRLASPGQRIVLYAKDRGCSFPNCDVPGYLTEVHHVTDFAQCQETDINELTQGCGPHHQLATTGGWITRKLKDGTTEWLPPAHLDHGQPRTNSYFHPEKLLHDSDEDDP